MSKLTNFVTRPIAAVAAIALLGMTLGTAQAAIVQVNSTMEGSDIEFPVSSTDLVNQGQATLFGQTTAGTALGGSDGLNLNDGSAGVNASLPSTAVYSTAWSTLYVLDTLTNTLGYDITGVTTYAGWESAGNADQIYELFVSVVNDPLFTSLGTFSYDITPTAGTRNSTRIVLTDGTGTLATGVDAVRFEMPLLAGNLTGVYREFDVFGAATVIPEPNSMALGKLGLIGMISLRKRNRC